MESFPPARGPGGFVLQNHSFLPRDFNPFESIFLIVRPVGVGTKVVSTLLPESPRG
jgi:hypothetical protein